MADWVVIVDTLKDFHDLPFLRSVTVASPKTTSQRRDRDPIPVQRRMHKPLRDLDLHAGVFSAHAASATPVSLESTDERLRLGDALPGTRIGDSPSRITHKHALLDQTPEGISRLTVLLVATNVKDLEQFLECHSTSRALRERLQNLLLCH